MRDFLKHWWELVVMIVAVGGLFGYIIYDSAVNMPIRRAVRQQQIDTFYVNHHCRPEGYVATKYEPIRTYRCDSGLYIAADMK